MHRISRLSGKPARRPNKRRTPPIHPNIIGLGEALARMAARETFAKEVGSLKQRAKAIPETHSQVSMVAALLA